MDGLTEVKADTTSTEIRQVLWGAVIAENLVKGKGLNATPDVLCRLREAVYAREKQDPLRSADQQALSDALETIDPGQTLLKPEYFQPVRDILLSTLNHLVYVPLPSYFVRDHGGRYETGSILGIGFTLSRIEKADLLEIDRLVLLAGILLRRFQDDFLSLRWVEQAYRSALRSAIATIMGRVNAHDIGHVLANARLPNESQSQYFRHLTDYLRTRMVFAAEAASADPGWSLSLPFCSMIVAPFASFPSKAKGRLRARCAATSPRRKR